MVMAENPTIHSQAGDIAFSDIEEIIADIRVGKMVIMVDDENRENEGDLLMAAEKVRAEDINYMARYGRGLICLTMTRERCAQLRLPLMVDETDQQGGCASGKRQCGNQCGAAESGQCESRKARKCEIDNHRETEREAETEQ